MNYINTSTNTYPVSEQDIRRAHPNTAFGLPFVPVAPYSGVAAVSKPAHSPLTHFVREIHPFLNQNTEYQQQWEVVEFAQPQKDILLQQAKNSQWTAIKAMRDNKVVSGGYKVGDDWFHSDLLSRSQQTALVIMGANIPSGLQWKTMDSTFVEMTQQLAADIFAAAAASDQALFAHAEALRVQVNSASDPYTVDIYSGWPEIFGDA